MTPASRPRWKAYLLLGRVSNLPTVWTNVLAATFLVTREPDLATLALGLVAVSLFYTGGMFLNDAFDWKYDTVHRPERPIPNGDLPAGEVYAVGFGLLAAGELLLAAPSILGEIETPWNGLAWGVVLAALIVYYDYAHKSDRLSPVVMALCRFSVYMLAGAFVGGAVPPPVIVGAAALAAYLVGLTYVAKQENLAAVTNSWPVVLIAVPFILYFPRTFGPGAILWTATLVWAAYALTFVYRMRGRSIPRTVVSLIAGISLVDGLAMVSGGASIGEVGVAVAGFGLTLAFQKWVPGT